MSHKRKDKKHRVSHHTISSPSYLFIEMNASYYDVSNEIFLVTMIRRLEPVTSEVPNNDADFYTL